MHNVILSLVAIRCHQVPQTTNTLFSQYIFLGGDKNSTENTILSADLEETARDAGWVISGGDPQSAAGRSWPGFGPIKALDPNADVQYDDEYFELMHSTNASLVCVMR